MEYEHIIHTIPPVYDRNSRVLILGTLPSPKSRENRFFYGNAQNRFWRVLAAVRDCAVPQTIAEKTDFLLKNRIALWDTIAQCRYHRRSGQQHKKRCSHRPQHYFEKRGHKNDIHHGQNGIQILLQISA